MKLADIPQPIYVVNSYLWDELKKVDASLAAKYKNIVPIFPINDAQAGTKQWGNKPYLIYDQAFRVSHSLYVNKKSTFIYSLRATTDEVFGWSHTIQQILDRQDDAAQDINDFNLTHDNVPVVFHSLRVYQNEPGQPRDSSTSPFVTSKFMVTVEYHLI